MKNLSGKKAIVFNTARFTGGKSLEYMKEKVEENGAQLIDFTKFRKLFWIGKKKPLNLVRKSIKFRNNLP